MTWLLDLDGVLWLAERPIAGAIEAVARLRARGEDVRFITNNSSMTLDAYVAKLNGIGVDAARDDVLTSAQACARLLDPGETALLCAGAGVEEALAARGVRTVRQGDADAVVVGWHRDFDFDGLARASRAVRGGARLLATNDDATYPAPDGPLPGCGSILAAVAVAAGTTASVAGKPYAPMVALVRERLAHALDGATLVGDRPDTDGRMARALGVRFALVLSGVTTREHLPVEPAPDEIADDLASLVPS